MRRRIVIVALLVGVLAACSGSTSRTAASNSPAGAAVATTTTNALPAAATTYTVATREETYVDATRRTAAHGSFPGAATRTIRVLYYYPTENNAPARTGAPFPLVLFSHGLTATPEVYRALLTDIAAAGYVVAAPAYPTSNGDAPGGPTAIEVSVQPADASFVITKTLGASDEPGWLHGLVDPNRIGAAGHSLGAITTYNLAYNATCADSRLKAAIVMSGTAAGCPGDYFTGHVVPLLETHGDSDETLNYKLGRSSFQNAPTPKYFFTIMGGRHSSEELGGTTERQLALTQAMIGFLDNSLKGNAAGLALMKAAAKPGVATLEAHP